MSRKNNLDLIRFCAAVAVMISHSVPLSLGRGQAEPLEHFTRGQASLGRGSVAAFLVLSGLLITRSYERTPTVSLYLWARALRIFPGLAAMLLLTVLVLGPCLTSASLPDYFSSGLTYRYFVDNVTVIEPRWNLPGVFVNNAYPDAVNGSLWTLKYEVGFYLLVALFGATRTLRWPVMAALWALAAVLACSSTLGQLWPEMFLYFGGGMILHFLGARLRWSPVVGLLCVASLIATARLGVGFRCALGSAGAYLLYHLAFTPSRWSEFARRGDFSYGIYIYGFAIQQVVTALLGGHTQPWINVALSLPVVLLLSIGSWHLIEKRALRRKGALPVWLSASKA
ncbi:MAG: acyltransferase [Myxococcales bacterium]|nr:MAG: acyltransferase [Myxococcales bacterium]